MKGEIQLTLRDRQTNEIKRQTRWIPNSRNDIWRMQHVILNMSHGNMGIPLRGLSRPNTGQYQATLGVGNFGI